MSTHSSELGLAALNFGKQHLGKSVTLDHNLNVVIYDKRDRPPDGAFFPACANFVWAALQFVGAKTTADFGKVDPPNSPPNTPSPTDYVWGDLVLTYNPGTHNVSSLSAVQPGDVLQFRNVTSGNEQHTSIVATNPVNGQFQVLQQNYNYQTWVTEDSENFNLYSTGTVWVYRPVAKGS
jgi:hypothetical protein